MNAFEFVFSLFGLLLGLSLVEVLNGLVRTSKARTKVRIGWLTPLLGVVVMMHVTTFWVDAWNLRDKIPVTNGALFVGLIMTSIYYYASSHVFPERPEDCPDLDDYFAVHKRPVLGGVIACQAIGSLVGRMLSGAPFTIAALAVFAAFAGLFAAPLFLQSRRANLIALSLIVAVLALVGVADTV